ncbi:PTS sugar transporter subunit IIA [Enterococcus sp. OL5]|uniref:PTS sugar transporter subunit IIA n=1 Tax=Enterococcus sp. OL5 TaxID=2590214 RepID=UPI001126C9DF|nr:PTS fructose transporter subunit IIA [Enterococcus sp. OL5]TPR56873.1 PTS fructose transporter subunit IIA [Enterococcus sp. OL5]
MTNIIITSHGNYAEGIKDTLTYFSGDLSNVYTVCLADKSVYDFQSECQRLLTNCEGEIVVLTDLYQGTPFKTFLTLLLGRKDAFIISNVGFSQSLTAILSKERDLKTVVAEVTKASNIELTDVSNIHVEISDEDE